MAQTTLLIDQLKKSLKAYGRTYADVAEHLNLSEASVKRLFSTNSFTLERLDQICQFIGLEISDLVRQMGEAAESRIIQLTRDQEKEIVEDTALLLVTICVLNKWALAEIQQYFHLTEHQCINHLAKLDRLGLIDLLPKNKIKILVAPNFKWIESGPILRFYQEKLEADFFKSQFDKSQEKLIVANGMLTESTNLQFQKKMEQLIKEFDELSQEDAQLPLDKRHGTTLVVAMRQWRYGLFDKLKK